MSPSLLCKGGNAVDRGKMGTVTIVVTVMILLTVFILIAYASLRQNQTQIVLPGESDASDVLTPEEENENESVISKVEVTPATVQNVIATLTRPDAYTRTVTITTFWSGGDGSTVIDTYVSGTCARMDAALPGGQVRHIIRTEEKTYIWYNNESDVYTAATGAFSEDDELWIPTYEDLLAVDPAEIIAADYETYQEVDCIYAATAEDADGYSERYWVAVDNGLLVAAQRLQNGETIYRMEGLSVNVGEFGKDIFTLPDGTNVYAESE